QDQRLPRTFEEEPGSLRRRGRGDHGGLAAAARSGRRCAARRQRSSGLGVPSCFAPSKAGFIAAREDQLTRGCPGVTRQTTVSVATTRTAYTTSTRHLATLLIGLVHHFRCESVRL